MPQPSLQRQFRRHSVPITLVAVVAGAVLFVPPLILGGLTTRTYAITAALLIIAVSTVLPYALLVAVGTLPLLYADIASFAAPRSSAAVTHPFSVRTALRHITAGVAYVLAAAVVGAIGIGAQMGGPDIVNPVLKFLQPVLLFAGGGIVATVFVSLQLWRYERGLRTLDWRTTLGTAGLGVLLTLSPVVAYWVFGNAAG